MLHVQAVTTCLCVSRIGRLVSHYCTQLLYTLCIKVNLPSLAPDASVHVNITCNCCALCNVCVCVYLRQ